jgi:hypothetical protein
VRTGLAFDSYLFRHDVFADNRSFNAIIPSFVRTHRPATVAGYLEDTWSPADAFQLRGGVRVLHAGGHGTAMLPRLGARLTVSPRLSLSLGAGRYAQVMSSLRNEESFAATLTAYDFLDATSANGLVRGADLVAGADWRTTHNISVRLEAYVKRTSGVPLLRVYGDAIEAPLFIVDSVQLGRSYARGLELFARYALGGREVSLSYALSRAEYDVANQRFPARYNRRHLLDLTATSPLGRRGEVSTRIVLGSGQPYTPAVGVASPLSYDPVTRGFWPTSHARTILLGKHNSGLLPGYVRVDVSLRKELEKKWFGRSMTIAPYLQVLNALNSKNTLIGDPRATGQLRIEHFPQLPILPTLGVEWRF